MAFGKRKVPVKPPEGHPLAGEMPLGQLPLEKPKAEEPSAEIDTDHYAPREDGAPPQRRIIPASMWEGQQGDLLRRVGMSPDDESNLVPDAHSVTARLERDKAEYEKRLAEMNRSISQRVPGGEMRGFWLLPDPCWNGRMGQFLMMRLGLFPYEDWNLVFLPTDEKTAEALNLPPHPGRDIPAFVTASERFLADVEAALQSAHAEAARTHEFGRFGETVEEIKQKVCGLARSFLGEMDKAWENRHG
jgi:hypothetical protein